MKFEKVIQFSRVWTKLVLQAGSPTRFYSDVKSNLFKIKCAWDSLDNAGTHL